MNLPSGESLVRQLVHGQRYFESRFGVRCTEVWIPDVFGYTASAPQIFRAGGCDRFVTQKLSWNKQNRFPHSTFRWRGLDGSEVLTHFPPVDTYNAEVSAEEVRYAEGNFREHGWSDWSLMPFGHGNGGGGPTREMLERARRMADLDGAAAGRSSAPSPSSSTQSRRRSPPARRCRCGTASCTSRCTAARSPARRRPRSATAAASGCCARPSCGGRPVATVPADVVDELDAAWKEVLLHQFHDIIPGSSIAWVHADTEAAHARARPRRWRRRSPRPRRGSCRPARTSLNADHRRRREVVAVASRRVARSTGRRRRWPTGARRAWSRSTGFGVAPLVAAAERRPRRRHRALVHQRPLAVSWDLDGSIVSIIDVRAGRELLPAGRRVELELAPDHPVEYDAWDVEAWTPGLGAPVGGVESVEVVDAGPLWRRCASPAASARRRSCRTSRCAPAAPGSTSTFDVDWHEDEQLLSLVVPLDVRAREAACDIQFGHVMRPDPPQLAVGRGEVRGVRPPLRRPRRAVVGRRRAQRRPLRPRPVRRRRARLAAARREVPRPDGRPRPPPLHDQRPAARSRPARRAPRGRRAERPAAARRRRAPTALAVAPVVAVDHPGVEVSAVKRADDGSGDLIVRLAEVCGDRTTVELRTPAGIRRAARATCWRSTSRSLDVADGFVALHLRPFELVTLRLAS